MILSLKRNIEIQIGENTSENLRAARRNMRNRQKSEYCQKIDIRHQNRIFS